MVFVSRVNVHTLGPLFVQAERAGVARAPLLAAVGLAGDALDDGQVAYDVVTALWQEAARRSGDAAFGMHAAEGAAPGVFDVVEYAAFTSLTLRDALVRLCRYQRLLTEVATFSLRGHALRLGYHLGANRLPPSRHASEYLLACVVRKVREATPLGQPVRVGFRHAAPPELAEHRRVFGCDVQFEAEVEEIAFAPGAFDATLERSDPVLRSILDRHAGALLERLPAGELFSARVGRWIGDQLATGQATLASAAAHFRLSERGVQRRLAAERESFEVLLERTRRSEAVRLLADRRLAIAEIAAALGFSEPSAFHRAFKRWNGVPPATYRKRLS